jgi:hypothetical protein
VQQAELAQAEPVATLQEELAVIPMVAAVAPLRAATVVALAETAQPRALAEAAAVQALTAEQVEAPVMPMVAQADP